MKWFRRRKRATITDIYIRKFLERSNFPLPQILITSDEFRSNVYNFGIVVNKVSKVGEKEFYIRARNVKK